MEKREILFRGSNDTLNFGDYTLTEKTKKSDFEYKGDSYKVKTFYEITKLEKNEAFVYESVPGTTVTDFVMTETTVDFKVEGKEDAQIAIELESAQEYKVSVDGSDIGTIKTNIGGKLVFSVELGEGSQASVKIEKQ